MTTETVLTQPQIDDAAGQIYGTMANYQETNFACAIEQAVLQSAEIQRLRRLAKVLEEKIASYERYGAICEFEGEPMIHASHLTELGDAAMEKKL